MGAGAQEGGRRGASPGAPLLRGWGRFAEQSFYGLRSKTASGLFGEQCVGGA